MRSFTISTDRIGPRRWCWVRIHPTAQSLRAAAQQLNPRVEVDDTGNGWADCYGVFQPPPRYTEGDPGWAANGYAGTIRLLEPTVTVDDDGDPLRAAEHAAHEVLHAAAQIYRMNVNRVLSLGNACGRHEEDLAYIYGELYADLQGKLT